MIVRIHDLAATELDKFISTSMDKFAKSTNGSIEGTIDLEVRLMGIQVDPATIRMAFLDGSSLKVNVSLSYYSSIEVI